MKKLRQGVHKFQQEVFGTQQEIYEGLAASQKPHTLFITCSDSRINPNVLTQAGPGEIFILRNTGNIIPNYATVIGGEAATIEFAVAKLGVQHIVVCGHSNCGAMKAVLNPKLVKDLPALNNWLLHAESIRNLLNKNYADCSASEHMSIAVQENVLLQLENLRTHPTVAERLAAGSLNLFAWVYKIPTGEVFAYSPIDEQFHPLAEVSGIMPNPLLDPDDDKIQI